MDTSNTNTTAWPAKWQKLADQIKSVIGVEPGYEEKFDLLRLDPKDRVQVRLDRNNAPQFMVDRFAFQMSETEFPPLVVSADDRTVDGNTRERAKRKREERYTSVFVVPLSWDDDRPGERKKLTLLGLYLNNQNGKPLDIEEQQMMVRDALDAGWTVTQIVYSVGIQEKTVRKIRDEMEAKRRFKNAGLNDGILASPVMRALGEQKLEAMSEEIYKGLASLAIDARYNASEVKAMAASLTDLTSDELRQDRLDRQREAEAKRIADVRQGAVGRPPLAKQLRVRLSWLLDGEAPVEAFVERNTENVTEHLNVLDKAIEKLEVIRDLQAAVSPAEPTAADADEARPQ